MEINHQGKYAEPRVAVQQDLAGVLRVQIVGGLRGLSTSSMLGG
jgi:hypothetical protein